MSVARRVAAARDFAGERDPEAPVDATSDISGDTRILLEKAIETQSLSARGRALTATVFRSPFPAEFSYHR